MSADNWAICPRCSEPDPFLPDIDVEQFRTFREDYEFYGAHEGVLQIYYSGACTVCGLNLKIDETREFWKADA